MNHKGQLITEDEAIPAKAQHTKPCSDCPWARKALAGWLGPNTREEWIECAHSDGRIDCHTLLGAQCAGAAIYRGNVCKTPRDESVLKLAPDHERVFATPQEFLEHHDMKRVAATYKKSGGR